MAPRIDFYIIPEKTSQAALMFACRLFEKAYNNKNTSYIYVEDEARAQQINDLLWTFRDISFIPHDLVRNDQAKLPVQIGFGANEPEKIPDILFNFTSGVPEFATKFNRIIEIAPQEPTWQNSARQNYRYYQTQGLIINNHDLRSEARRGTG